MRRDPSADSADELIDQAWDEATPAARVGYARRALIADPDAIDGYVILALSTEALGEQIALLREAVRIGRQRLAEAIKRPSAHYFWLDIETRPFMRAAHNLALALWRRGEPEEAVALVDLLLKLNPNDNQGARYLALAWHPLLGNWAAVTRLLKRYRGEKGTEYLYAAALDAFRQDSDPLPLLREAIQTNSYAPALLLGDDPAESDLPYVEFGSFEEAAAYARMSREAWSIVPGALDWLKQSIG